MKKLILFFLLGAALGAAAVTPAPIVRNPATTNNLPVITHGPVTFWDFDTNKVQIYGHRYRPAAGDWVWSGTSYTNIYATNAWYWQPYDDEFDGPSASWILTNSADGLLVAYGGAVSFTENNGFPKYVSVYPPLNTFESTAIGTFGFKASTNCPGLHVGSNLFVRVETSMFATATINSYNSTNIGFRSIIEGGAGHFNRGRDAIISGGGHCSILSANGSDSIRDSEACVLDTAAGVASIIACGNSTNFCNQQVQMVGLMNSIVRDPSRNAVVRSGQNVDFHGSFSDVAGSYLRVTNCFNVQHVGNSNLLLNLTNVQIRATGITLSNLANAIVEGNAIQFSGTNYAVANFTPRPGFIIYAPSNYAVWSITPTKTNLVVAP